MDTIELPSAIEPAEWFVVFHRKSMNRMLSLLAFGEFKHVSAFGYCAGYKVWLVYDVQWGGTRIWLADKASVMAWSEGCDIVKVARAEGQMAASSRLGLYCVNAIKHLLRLKGGLCVALTPAALYRHILRNGGTLVAAGHAPTAPGRSEPRERAATGAERPHEIAAG